MKRQLSNAMSPVMWVADCWRVSHVGLIGRRRPRWKCLDSASNLWLRVRFHRGCNLYWYQTFIIFYINCVVLWFYSRNKRNWYRAKFSPRGAILPRGGGPSCPSHGARWPHQAKNENRNLFLNHWCIFENQVIAWLGMSIKINQLKGRDKWTLFVGENELAS